MNLNGFKSIDSNTFWTGLNMDLNNASRLGLFTNYICCLSYLWPIAHLWLAIVRMNHLSNANVPILKHPLFLKTNYDGIMYQVTSGTQSSWEKQAVSIMYAQFTSLNEKCFLKVLYVGPHHTLATWIWNRGSNKSRLLKKSFLASFRFC